MRQKLNGSMGLMYAFKKQLQTVVEEVFLKYKVLK